MRYNVLVKGYSILTGKHYDIITVESNSVDEAKESAKFEFYMNIEKEIGEHIGWEYIEAIRIIPTKFNNID